MTLTISASIPHRVTAIIGVALSQTIKAELNVRTGARSIDPYTGDYTVTPSFAEQTLNTNGKRMTDDVTIAAIPSNYGLITYNGFEITVS